MFSINCLEITVQKKSKPLDIAFKIVYICAVVRFL